MGQKSKIEHMQRSHNKPSLLKIFELKELYLSEGSRQNPNIQWLLKELGEIFSPVPLKPASLGSFSLDPNKAFMPNLAPFQLNHAHPKGKPGFIKGLQGNTHGYIRPNKPPNMYKVTNVSQSMPFRSLGIVTDALEKVWFYLDNENRPQGPFSTKEMDAWYIGGFFPLNLSIAFKKPENFKDILQFVIEYQESLMQASKKVRTDVESSKPILDQQEEVNNNSESQKNTPEVQVIPENAQKLNEHISINNLPDKLAESPVVEKVSEKKEELEEKAEDKAEDKEILEAQPKIDKKDSLKSQEKENEQKKKTKNKKKKTAMEKSLDNIIAKGEEKIVLKQKNIAAIEEKVEIKAEEKVIEQAVQNDDKDDFIQTTKKGKKKAAKIQLTFSENTKTEEEQADEILKNLTKPLEPELKVQKPAKKEAKAPVEIKEDEEENMGFIAVKKGKKTKSEKPEESYELESKERKQPLVNKLDLNNFPVLKNHDDIVGWDVSGRNLTKANKPVVKKNLEKALIEDFPAL